MNVKKVLLIILTIIICALIVVGCLYLYMYFTKQKDNESKLKNVDALFNENSYPIVDGIYLTADLAKEFKENFIGKEVNETNYSETEEEAYKNLVGGLSDLILVLTPTEAEREIASKQGVSIEVRQVCDEAFVFVVNKENKVDDLSLEDVRKIYTGEITNWSQVGGDDLGIRAFQREKGSINQLGMENLVMNGASLIPPMMAFSSEYNYNVKNIVAEYDNGLESIGYSYLYYADKIYNDEETKILSINGIYPTEENIRSGKYPLRTGYYAVIKSDEPEDSNVRKLLEAIMSERGKKILEEAGYVTIR